MKSCAYCGRDNSDGATHCCECGCVDLVAVLPSETASPPEVVEQGAEEDLELVRSNDPEVLYEIAGILDSAQIGYRRFALPAMYNPFKAATTEPALTAINVPRRLYGRARFALEREYLKTELPPNHYLRTATDMELAEVVRHATEWSAFHVAHARRLMTEKGIDLSSAEVQIGERLRRLRQGQRAPTRLILLGWVCSALGGIIGIGIAWSIVHKKEMTSDGVFFAYDERSRAIGRTMFEVAMAVLLVIVAVWCASISYSLKR